MCFCTYLYSVFFKRPQCNVSICLTWLDLTPTHPYTHTHPPIHTHTLTWNLHFVYFLTAASISKVTKSTKDPVTSRRENTVHILTSCVFWSDLLTYPPKGGPGDFWCLALVWNLRAVCQFDPTFFFYISLHFVLLLCPVALCVLSFFLLLAHSPDLLFPKSPFPKGWLFCVALVFLLVWAVRRWMQYYTGICL